MVLSFFFFFKLFFIFINDYYKLQNERKLGNIGIIIINKVLYLNVCESFLS